MSRTATQKDVDFFLHFAKLLGLWAILLLVSGVALILYGDVLMELFT